MEFYEDARAARELLEDVSGRPVRGFRAPAFSVTERTPWFFDKLVEAGYRYDSSVFPAPHQTGGLATGAFAPYTAQDAGGRDRGISDHGRARVRQAHVLFRRRLFAVVSRIR